jgi:hypothetical protein
VAKIPDRGFCIAPAGRGYVECFPYSPNAKRRARAAARRLAKKLINRVHLVQVQNRGNDRFIIAEFEPKHWKG